MSGILAIRLHLDESGLDNGPLRVIAGSHREGRLPAEQIGSWEKENSVTCTVPRGGALVMRPVLLHASSACAIPKSRRVSRTPKKRHSPTCIVAPANRVLPVATCFTGTKLRVSVFSRTAIHAPGGWALIENLPNVLTGDRVTVELWSTEIPSPEDKAFVSLCANPFVGLVTQQCCARTNPGFGSGVQFEAGRVMRDQRGHLA
jgi:hypothetical protein